MKIDFHVHFYPEKVAEKAVTFVRTLGFEAVLNGTRDGLEQSMKTAGIDISVGMPVVNKPESAESVNKYAAENNFGGICMFGSLHPFEKDPVAAVDRIKELGLYGIKVHPEYQNFSFDDESLFPIWQRCAELELPLLTHAGADIAYKSPFKTNPRMLAEFHRKIPELTFIAAHFGGYKMWNEVEQYLIGSGVYLDMSLAVMELPQERLSGMVRKHGADKVLFATDSPWFSQQEAVVKTEKLALTAHEFEKIYSGNALKLLHLS